MDISSNPVSDDRDDHVSFGCFRLDQKHMVLWREGQALPLGPKVVHTLAALIARRGEIVSKEELIREVWGDIAVDENSVAQNIYILRKTLNGDVSRAFTLETIPRRGYRLCATSDIVQTKPDSDGLLAFTLRSGDVQRPSLREVWCPSRLKTVLVFLGVLSITGTLMYQSSSQFSAKRRPRRSVAVIGFVNLSHQPEYGWLSPALTEMMVTELAADGKLLTIPDETVARAQAELKLTDQDGFSSETLNRLRHDINADLVVSGAFAMLAPRAPQLGGGRVRLDLRLQDAHNGQTLDAVSEVGEQSDLFNLIARAGTRIRQDLGTEPVTAEQAVQARASVSSSPQTLRLYAQGIEKLRRFDALGAQEFLQKAVLLDPKYALGHSAYSEALGMLGYDEKSKGEAKTAFELAGELSPEERLSIEGQYWMATRDRKKAVQVYEKLFNSFPDNLDYGLKLASAQIAASDTRNALATLNLLRHLPRPASIDPRISITEHALWTSTGDYKRVESSLVEAADSAKQQGASLLLAQARARLCWVRIRVAKPEQAMRDCQEARQIYASVGDRSGEANVLRLLGDLAAGSDFQAAVNYYQRALAIEQEIGHLTGQAAVINQLAILYSRQGDHVAAKNSYEQALAIFRQLDAKPDSIGVLLNVGLESVALGEFEQAMKVYHEAFAQGAEVGNQDIAALAEQNIGLLQQSQGDVRAAKQSFELALTGFQGAGDTAYVAATLNFLGEVAMAEGDFDAAHKQFDQALSLEPPHRGLWAVSEMDLAELSLTDERACRTDAKTSILGAREVFRVIGSVDAEAAAATLLARCLLADGLPDAALDVIEEATEISNKAQPDVRLLAAVTAAQIRFASRANRTAPQALESLRRTAAAARKLGFLAIELEARLAVGEIEVQSGTNSRGRADLRAVEKEAEMKGLVLLARKAKAAA